MQLQKGHWILNIKWYYFKDKSLVSIPVSVSGGEAGITQIQAGIIKNSDFHNTFINYKEISQGHLLVLLKSEENVFMMISG